MIKRYVVGFLFEDGHVLLIKKRPGPHYVSGLLNGIGGTIEVGETPDMAMTRELREEAGITLPTGIAWHEYHREFRPDTALHFFCADASDLKYPLVVTKRTDHCRAHVGGSWSEAHGEDQLRLLRHGGEVSRLRAHVRISGVIRRTAPRVDHRAGDPSQSPIFLLSQPRWVSALDQVAPPAGVPEVP